MLDLKMFMVFLGNPYKDKDGKPTNGSTTGAHLHLGIRVDDKYINPLTLFKKEDIN